MSDRFKNWRRERIARLVERREDYVNKKTKAPATTKADVVEPRERYTFWMTRDERAGGLQPTISVWLAAPTRSADGRWDAHTADGAGALYTTWPVEHAQKEAGSVPQTSRECIRVGKPEDAWVPGKLLATRASA